MLPIKQQLRRLAIGLAVCLGLPLLAYALWTPGVASTGGKFDRSRNGLWLAHGWMGDAAWFACLWALADYRGTAERFSSPRLLPGARRFIAAISAVREQTRSPGPAEPGSADYGDQCDDRCH